MAGKAILMALGQRIKYIRKSARISQEALAESTDLHPTYISMIESGKTNPTVEILLKIAGALKVDLSALLSGNLKGQDQEAEAKLVSVLSKLRHLPTKDQIRLLEAFELILGK